MSIPIRLEDLPRALAEHDLTYLLTIGPGGVKALGVDLHPEGAELVVTTSSPGTATNLSADPRITLLCPPREPEGYTLLVDGTATVAEEGFRITPEAAILHRPAAGAAGRS